MRGSLLVFLGGIVLLFVLLLVLLQPKPADRTQKQSPSQGESDSVDHSSARIESGAAMPSDNRTTAGPSSADATSPAAEVRTDPAVGAVSASSAEAAKDRSAEVIDRPAFPGWPTPALALVVTGEMRGYFEPCGCTANQLGGMSRRGDLFRQMTELGWKVRGVDIGSLARRTVRQAQIKLETTLAAMRELGYAAVALGPEELRLDPGYLISQHMVDGDRPLYFLSANLVFFGTPDLGTPQAYTIIEQNGLRLGITSVMSESQRNTVLGESSGAASASADVTWTDPVAALSRVLEQFEQQGVHRRILLSQGTVEESRRLAERFPSFDLIVTAMGFGEGSRTPEMIGSVRLLQVGEKGKHAGVVGFYADDAESPIRFELVTLSGAQFGESASMTRLMSAYQERLRDERIAVSEKPVVHPSGAAFIGVEKCGECHTKAYEKWQSTAHAHAFDSLDPVHRRTGFERLHGVARRYDPECLSCHVTGWDPQEFLRFDSGFVSPEFAESDQQKQRAAWLTGNQCENCHGPGSRHVELVEAGDSDAAGREMRVTLQQARDSLCVSCHDGDNSPEFQFEKYWQEVEHSGKD